MVLEVFQVSEHKDGLEIPPNNDMHYKMMYEQWNGLEPPPL